MTKRLWIIANWKSNKTIAEALQWLDEVGPKIPRQNNLKVAICPPFTDIEEVKKTILVNNYPLIVGSQDLSPFEEGPYTGEEPAKILDQLVELAILGHSERRQNFGETDEMISEKVSQAAQFHIIPVVCVQGGETPIPPQVKVAAYEPLFAIGTGNADSPANAAAVAEKLKIQYGADLEVLYGGSVTPENARGFLQQENISGLLVGKASLDAGEFVKIVETASKV